MLVFGSVLFLMNWFSVGVICSFVWLIIVNFFGENVCGLVGYFVMFGVLVWVICVFCLDFMLDILIVFVIWLLIVIGMLFLSKFVSGVFRNVVWLLLIIFLYVFVL